jgi:hypothetical protein
MWVLQIWCSFKVWTTFFYICNKLEVSLRKLPNCRINIKELSFLKSLLYECYKFDVLLRYELFFYICNKPEVSLSIGKLPNWCNLYIQMCYLHEIPFRIWLLASWATFKYGLLPSWNTNQCLSVANLIYIYVF